jgi:hypothetical protein
MQPLSDGELIKEPLSVVADAAFSDKEYNI